VYQMQAAALLSACHAISPEGVKLMKIITIRKAGSVRLTAAACYCYGCCCCLRLA